jgi:spore coat protein U-like protein
MNWLIKSGTAFAVLSALAAPAWAQNNSASVTTTGSTTIAAPITLTQNSTLRFGSLVRPTSNSNVVTVDTLNCATALRGSGNASLISSTSGCATYTVGGESGQAFNVATDPTFDMSRSGGSEKITVTLSKSASTGTIGQTSADFKVGGSFPVDSTTVAGAYSGSFTVTATYQ